MDRTTALTSFNDLRALITQYKEVITHAKKYIEMAQVDQSEWYSDEIIVQLNDFDEVANNLKELSLKYKNVYLKTLINWDCYSGRLITKFEMMYDFDLSHKNAKRDFTKCSSYRIDCLFSEKQHKHICDLIDELAHGIKRINYYLHNEYEVTMYERIEAHSWCRIILRDTLDELDEAFEIIDEKLQYLLDEDEYSEHVYFEKLNDSRVICNG